MRTVSVLAMVASLFFMLPLTMTQAQILCNQCSQSQYEAVAANSGVSPVFVFDVKTPNLTYWRLVRDRESGAMEARELAVPDGAMTPYLNTVQYVVLSANGDIHATLTPGSSPGPGPFYGYNPLNGHESLTAYDIARGGTLRNQIGDALVRGISSRTGIASIDGAVNYINSLLMAGVTPDTSEHRIIVTIVWRDGSKTVYTISSAFQHDYQDGQSSDPNGNPIMDSSLVTNPEFADLLDGEQFVFSTPLDLQRWVDQLMLFGIPVVGGSTSRIGCVRIGNGGMECSYQ
jgi:hypothetical protein